ncbi:TonB dependent receptor [Candidatus Symbiothrix dinenymphae]|nr:TonB dependent receptor [Candidatus Symbiothrix dinenymphae]
MAIPSSGTKTITGFVYDEAGDGIPGSTITIKGSTRGVVTDMDGSFKIDVSPTDVLEVSFLGYDTYTVTVGDKANFVIPLKPQANELDEVTIVAFGKQKKESVVGSITTINVKDLKVPSSNLTTALAGQMAGVIAYQRSGEPGKDNADFFVRGITTFGANTNPLILIDNVELTTTDLARLQPDDIESFSIMKDATATALYGARGANGVIFVTTKQGKEGPAKISVRVENSFSSPTRNIEFADPVTYMNMHNEAVLTRNPLERLPYGQSKIDNTAAGKYPLLYPANDWRKMLFKDYSTNQRANLSVSGGGGVARYYVAGSFSQDNGNLIVDKRNSFDNNVNFRNYTLRANVNINVTKTTELAVRLSGNFDDYTGPLDGGAAVYNKVVHANPVLFPAYFPVDDEHSHIKHIMFGNKDGLYMNPYAEMVKGYMNESRSQMLAQVEAKQDLKFITEGLSIRAMLNVSRLASFNVKRQYSPFWYQVASSDQQTGTYSLIRTNPDSGTGKGTEYLDLVESRPTVESTLYSETVLNYSRTFAKQHSVSGLLVLTTREFLNANAGGQIQESLPSRNAGLSGRATYSYGGRYFSEFNFGYNGSERFAANHRFGFFPSAGVAWNIANEAFWENLQPTVNNLKLRYSLGLVGNDRIGTASDRFFYLSKVVPEDASRRSYFGTNADEFLNGFTISRYASDNITWETALKQNYAVEVGLWNKVNIIAEYFTEYRKNILMDRMDITSTMGLTVTDPVRANIGEASGKGVDLTAEYQQSWNKDFWTAARANFTYATSKYEVYEEPEYPEYWRTNVGRSLQQNWGYIAERLFMDDAEARNSPSQDFGSPYGGGDIKYTDVNKDGKITTADMVPLGYPKVPEIVYGFGFSAGYKGFDASFFFQGAGRESFWIDPSSWDDGGTIRGTAPFVNDSQLLKAYADSHWSESNQNMYAVWPRFSNYLNNNNTQPSTWFMRDGSFIRLKQAEIGYTIPGKWQEKLHVGNLRLYVSGVNLLLFSKFKLWDVEMAGEGLGYPIQRVFNVGLNLMFN